MLQIVEHKSASYAPRTYHNALSSDVTMALAFEFNTKGEQLTKTAAGAKYLGIPLPVEAIIAARALWKRLNDCGGSVVNVAGNGIYILSTHGWTQEKANAHLHAILAKVHAYSPIQRVVTGGQTGIDIAGAIAGFALGIDTIVTMPKGYLQRHEGHTDRPHTRDQILRQIYDGTKVLAPQLF